MADNTVKILLLVVILLVLWYVYQQNKTPMFIGPSGEAVEQAAEEIVHRDCSGTEYIIQKPCSRNGIVLDGLSDETSGAGFETHVLDKNHEGFVRQLGDGVCPPKLVECNVDPPKPCSGNTWLDAMCVRLDVNGNELVLEDGNADACGDGILKQTLDTNAPDYEPATQGGLCTFERSGACQKTCPEAQPPACNYPVEGWQMNDLGCVKSRDDLTPVGCGETGEIQLYKAATMNTEYCKNLTKWQSCTMQACPQDCVGSWSDWTPNPDACDVQPSESRIYSITKEAVGNTQYGYGKPCEEIHDKVETRSRQDPIQPCCTQSFNWTGPIGACRPDGFGIFTQTVSSGCPEDVKSEIKECCYEKGDWTNSGGGCKTNGTQTQKQTTKGNCIPGTETREVPCCYKTEWVGSNECSSSGIRTFTRTIRGSCDSVPLEDDKELCDSELARLKTISGKEGVEGVRYVWFGFDNKTEYLNIAGIEIYSGGENLVKDWAELPPLKSASDFTGPSHRRRREARLANAAITNAFGDELKKKVTVNSIHSNDSATGDYGTMRLFDGDSSTMYHSAGNPNDWIKIDLGKEYTIDEVKVFNRYSCGDNGHCNNRWESAVLKLLDSSENVLKTGEAITVTDTVNKSKTYSFSVDPDTLAKLEEVMDVVPADLSTITDSQWRKIIPACEFTSFTDEDYDYKEELCQYVGNWGNWGECDGINQTRDRTVFNGDVPDFITGTLNPSSSETRSCSHCKGYWFQNHGGYSGNRGNRHKRDQWEEFKKTKNHTPNTRGECPSTFPSHGARRTDPAKQKATDSWFKTAEGQHKKFLGWECAGWNPHDPDCNA